MKKLARNYLYNITYQLFIIIVPLVTAPYLTRVLSANTIGTYDYVISITGLINSFGTLGLNSYSYRQIAYVRGDRKATEREFSRLYYLRCILFGIMSFIYLPIIIFHSEFSIYFLIQYIWLIGMFLDFGWMFIAHEDMGIVTLQNFVAKLITVLGIFLFIKSDKDLWIYFTLNAGSLFVTTIVALPILFRYTSFKKVHFGDIMAHIPMTIKLFLPQIAVNLYLQIGKILLNQLTGDTSQVAYYSYAEKIINIPLGFITALGVVMMPRMANLHSNNKNEELNRYLCLTLQFASLVSIPLFFGLISVSSQFIPWYLGDKFSVVSNIIILLSPVILLSPLNNIFGGQYLTAKNITKILIIAGISAAILNVSINIALIPILGYTGTAIAMVATMFCEVSIQFYAVQKQVNLKSIVKPILKNLISGILMFVCLLVFRRFLNNTPMSTLILVSVGVVVYLLMNICLKDELILSVIQRIKVKGKL